MIPNKHVNLDERFIKENADDINWFYVSQNMSLAMMTDEFIERFDEDIKWYGISSFCTLSEVQIHKFRDKLNWKDITSFHRLSVEFIESHLVYVDWKVISNIKYPKDFFIKHKDLVDWPTVLSNRKLDFNTLMELKQFHRENYD